ncbi:MAG: hypothetical protein KBT06_07675 [Prevotellaceae bacterium]|nr:hypothetical protein [Candidatus Colivivens equi]
MQIIKKINRSINEILEFGLVYFFQYRLVGRIKGCAYKQQITLDYLRKRYSKLISKEVCAKEKPLNSHQDTIWVCWWQGESQMPPIVKACYASLKKYSNGHPIKLITKDNYRQYVEFPEWVEEKFASGIITITHLSDLLRLALLKQYGGLWMDATLYLTKDLPAQIPTFFTLKQKEELNDVFLSKHRWAGFCIGGNMNNPLWSLVYTGLVSYWYEHNQLIDYYVFDYIIELIYESYNEVKNLIDNNKYSNPDLAFFSVNGNEEFDVDKWKEITSRTDIFKLSWKGEIKTMTQDGKKTYHGYIM